MSSNLLNPTEKKAQLENSFRLIEKIGQGSYGAVYKGVHLRTTQLVAIKQIPIDSDLTSLMQEISVLAACQCPYIVALHGYFVEDALLSIVLEFCEAGSVSDIAKKLGEPLMEQHIACLMRDALLGLEFLHERSKIHRDIKAGNILVDSKGRGKLADFGVAGQLSDATAKRNTVIGTPYWMAPEVIQEVGYTTKADIWSLGITCIEMAEGHPPFHDLHPMKAIFIIPSQPPPRLSESEKWSSAMQQFVGLCLTKDPDQRPSATKLLGQASFVQSSNPNLMLQFVQRFLPRTPQERSVRPRRPSNASSVHSYVSDGSDTFSNVSKSPQPSWPPPERPERNHHRRLGSTSSISPINRRASIEAPWSATSSVYSPPPSSHYTDEFSFPSSSSSSSSSSRPTPRRRASEDPNIRVQKNIIAFDPREDSLRNLKKSMGSSSDSVPQFTSRMRSSSSHQSSSSSTHDIAFPRRHRSSSTQSNGSLY